MPQALGSAGFVAHTMFSVYGEGAEERISDVDWIAEGAERGWILLTKDRRIRYVPAELEAVSEHRARVFCLALRKLKGAEQAECFRANINRIIGRARRPGPFIDLVYEKRVDPWWPRG